MLVAHLVNVAFDHSTMPLVLSSEPFKTRTCASSTLILSVSLLANYYLTPPVLPSSCYRQTSSRGFSIVRVRLLIIFIITVNVFPLRLSFLTHYVLTIVMVYLNVSYSLQTALRACDQCGSQWFWVRVRLHNRTIVNQLITSPHNTQTTATGSILLQ
uniref:Uncharacterized protein n=1 Tax=Anopheles christyi TaxID=43041 RepID=A0A182JSN0_9DIPT